MTTSSRVLRPFAVIGFSIADEAVCPECLRTSVPVTGERVSHTCRRNRVHLTDHTRSLILELANAHTRPTQIAKDLKLTLPTVMRVISGDADDDATCPACEAGKRTEHRDVLPLYAADPTMAEETCTHCGRHLLSVALDRLRTTEANTTLEYSTTPRGYPSLRFATRPPADILQALKAAGWRWDPRERVWFDPSKTATLPAGVTLPPPAPVVAAKPPLIRRRPVATA